MWTFSRALKFVKIFRRFIRHRGGQEAGTSQNFGAAKVGWIGGLGFTRLPSKWGWPVDRDGPQRGEDIENQVCTTYQVIFGHF